MQEVIKMNRFGSQMISVTYLQRVPLNMLDRSCAIYSGGSTVMDMLGTAVAVHHIFSE